MEYRNHLFIIRHGETNENVQGIVQGSGVNSNINERGIWQSKAFHHHYQHVPFQRIYTSALKRTSQTIAPFLQTGSVEHVITPLINEISWGAHEGMAGSRDQIDAFNQVVQGWAEGKLDLRIEQGESANELQSRLNAFIQELPESFDDPILICTHGRTIRCLVALLEGHGPDKMERYPHSNTGLYLFKREPSHWQLIKSNSIEHLEMINSNPRFLQL